MYFWNILEIDPTDNVSIVKKAYAKKLKLHHPEDDPEGYQKLREAYDSALKYLKNNKNKLPINSIKKEKIEVPEIIFKEDNLGNTKEAPPHMNILEEFTEKAQSFEEIVEKFISKAQILYDNFFSRINIENWITLLNSEAMWYMGDKKLLSNKMIEFLIENHYLPRDIWKLLEDNFNWKEQKEYLYKKYPKEFIDYLFKQINDNNGLRYCYFKEASEFDYETFLEYREEAFEALSNNDFDYAEECINNAYNIYADDPDLLLMRGRWYLHGGDEDKALQIFGNLIQRDSEDIYARFYRAKVLYNKGQIHSALDDCKYIEAHNFENWNFLLFFAKCYFKFEEFDNAKEMLLLLLNIDSLCVEAKDLLEQVNLQLVYKLRVELKKNKKNEEINSKLDKLYKELGMLENKQLIRKMSYIMIRRIIICLLILFLQVKIIHSAMKSMDVKEPNSLKSTAQFIMVRDKAHLVKNSEDINKLPAEISTVQGKLTNARYLDLYRIPIKGKQGKINTLYLSLKEAEAKGLFDDMNGYVCIGTLGDKKVIAIVDYEKANQAYKTKTLDFNGGIHYMPADDLVSEVKKRCMTNKFEKEFITDIFIDTEVKISSTRQVTLGTDALLLFIQAAIIIQGLVAGYMLVKVNRKGMCK